MSLRLADTPRGDRSRPLNRDDLIAFFHRQGKTQDRWRVGAEFEKLALRRSTGLQVPYRGEDGIEAILESLGERFGWSSHRENGDVVALVREAPCEGEGKGRSTITLEPGGQIELATPPCRLLQTMNGELMRHRDELRAVISDDTAIVATGLTPISRVADLPMTSRERHQIMARYLPAKGHLALHMMKATSSVQVALDFVDEADASSKFFCALTLSPICTALFANSPLHAGENTGLVSYRGRVWQHTDPDRSGLLEDVVGDGAFTFEKWVDYLLDVPMMFYAIDDRWEDAKGQTFRAFMRDGHNGTFPTQDDWELHLTSVFPEVRLKQFVEVRGADAVTPDLAMGFPGMWKGIFYDSVALDEALTLAREVGGDHRADLFEAAITAGLRARHKGRTLGEWATDLLEIARRGLRRQVQSLGIEDESAFLDPIQAIAEGGRSPADLFLDRLDAAGGDPARIVSLLEY